MDLAVLNAVELPAALRALRAVALAGGSVSATGRALLETLARLHGTSIDVDGLAPIAPEEVARVIVAPHRRKRTVQLALVAALADGEATPAQEAEVKALARALEVNEQGLRVLHDVVGKHRLLARFDMTRRLFGKFVGRAYEEEGLSGVSKFMSVFTGVGGEDPAVAWRYRELGLLPEGTLGRTFWEHCTRRHFAFPGEKGGIPERAVFHDFGHVLAGYDTDPAGEIQQGAFQAGFIRNDGFVFLLFVILQFHLGVKVTPVAEGETGYFDPVKVLRAVERGAACRVDLSDGWSPWEVVGKPLEEVRREYGIAPL